MVGSDPQASDLAQTLFMESLDAVFIVDGDQRKVLDANRAAMKWTGLNQQDLLSARFDQLLQWQENHVQRLAEVSAETPYRPAVLHSRKAGPMPVQASVIPLPGSKTRRSHVIVVRDARQIKALESGNKTLMERMALLELENAQLRETRPGGGYYPASGAGELAPSGDMIEEIARHFNDMATVVIASATLVRGSINSTSPNQTFLKAIEEATVRASDMMTRLLGAVGRAPFQRHDTALSQLLETALQKVTVPAEITVKSNVATTVGTVAGDPELLQRALHDILQNAIEAMPRGGQITLDATTTQLDEKDLTERGDGARPGTYLKLRIIDTGSGLDRNTLPRAGTLFFTTKNDPKKLGLGLAYVQGISRQHGGWMELTSTPGKSTHVTLFLPRGK